MPVPASLTDLVARFAGMRVLVIGDAMLDIYTRGVTGRICPEAPVPVIDVMDQQFHAGGAANTAANLASLGGRSRSSRPPGTTAMRTRCSRC